MVSGCTAGEDVVKPASDAAKKAAAAQAKKEAEQQLKAINLANLIKTKYEGLNGDRRDQAKTFICKQVGSRISDKELDELDAKFNLQLSDQADLNRAIGKVKNGICSD
jgi:hypothetical protein